MSLSTPDSLFLSFQEAIAGRYSIDRELGRGGSGIVFLAREVHLDRPVAIKLLGPDKAADAALRARFIREAQLAARLSHPHIIPIHAVHDDGRFVFYVMAYVDGESLGSRIRTRGPLGNSEGARILREVAWALAHAHSHGLVHRDVKPDNILIEQASGRALVADFGIAAATLDTNAGVSGTPEFMSPEQALDQAVDARSDLYSLGVTAFYAFSGRLPFEGTAPTQVIARAITEPAPSLASMGMPVSRRLCVLVDRCLAKKPAARPASADDVAHVLGVALDQRRELPAALRSFVRRDGRMNGGGTLAFPGLLLTAAIAAAATLGETAGFLTFAAGAALAPCVFVVEAARRLLRHGFVHADLIPAFREEAAEGHEERAAVHGVQDLRPERLYLGLAVVCGAVWATDLTALLFFPGGRLVFGSISELAFPLSLGGCILSILAFLTRRDRRRDVDTDFWSRVWSGPVGRVAFAIARRLGGRPTAPAAVTHRATELSLGMAVESLFESLPAATRAPLRTLPAIASRLQTDAQALRTLHDNLNDGIADLGGAEDSDAYRDLCAHRDRVRDRMTQAVGALESIRLNLLRLHAGSGSVEGLTTHIDMASELSADISRLVAARQEIEAGLSFPREIASTPA